VRGYHAVKWSMRTTKPLETQSHYHIGYLQAVWIYSTLSNDTCCPLGVDSNDGEEEEEAFLLCRRVVAKLARSYLRCWATRFRVSGRRTDSATIPRYLT
jgi:hypothetical protein